MVNRKDFSNIVFWASQPCRRHPGVSALIESLWPKVSTGDEYANNNNNTVRMIAPLEQLQDLAILHKVYKNDQTKPAPNPKKSVWDAKVDQWWAKWQKENPTVLAGLESFKLIVQIAIHSPKKKGQQDSKVTKQLIRNKDSKHKGGCDELIRGIDDFLEPRASKNRKGSQASFVDFDFDIDFN